MKKIKIAVRNATSVALAKTGASLRLGGGIAGDVAATGGQLVGGAIAVTGGAVALVGFTVYAGGMLIRGASDQLAAKAQGLQDRAFADLTRRSTVIDVEEVAPPPPPSFAPDMATA